MTLQVGALERRGVSRVTVGNSQNNNMNDDIYIYIHTSTTDHVT